MRLKSNEKNPTKRIWPFWGWLLLGGQAFAIVVILFVLVISSPSSEVQRQYKGDPNSLEQRVHLVGELDFSTIFLEAADCISPLVKPIHQFQQLIQKVTTQCEIAHDQEKAANSMDFER